MSPRAAADECRPVRCLVLGEYTIGHVPFVDELARRSSQRSDIELQVVRLPPGGGRSVLNLSPYKVNYSLGASAQARLRSKELWPRSDVVLVHTQTAALLLGRRRMRQTPTWISSDATPANLDEVGSAYEHSVGPAAVERAKRFLVSRAYARATGVVAWSSWVATSLSRDYGVPAARVHIVRPGVRLPPRRAEEPGSDELVRLLFVGGDFRRKGGPVLLEALDALGSRAHLDVVTTSDVPAREGVTIHRGLTPGCEQLNRLYSAAHIAVLPTRGDASPYAVVEAMAHGLPVVATAVGAVAEAVLDGVTGSLVRPDDAPGLAEALRVLIADPALRRRFGEAGRTRAEARYDGDRSTDLLLDLLVASARAPRRA